MTARSATCLTATSCLLLGLVAPLASQGLLTGIVREDGTGKALAGVEILIENSKLKATSDAAGRFAIEIPNGNRVALFRAIGFRPLRLRVQSSKGDTLSSEPFLVPESAHQLDSITVTGRVPAPHGIGLEAFEERRKLGFGKFLDSTELRRAEGRQTMDVLRSVPGLNFVKWVSPEDLKKRPWLYEWRLVGRSQASGDSCYMSVLVDGLAVYRHGAGQPLNFRYEFSDVSSFEAIEVYRSASEVPQEFGGPAEECGMVMFWTRRTR